MLIIAKTPSDKLVFIIDEHGRTLTEESLKKILSELFGKVLNESDVDATVANGPSINNCKLLLEQITERDIATWELVYLHDSKYPPVLLTNDDKKELLKLLSSFDGTSAGAIYKVLVDAGAYAQFD